MDTHNAKTCGEHRRMDENSSELSWSANNDISQILQQINSFIDKILQYGSYLFKCTFKDVFQILRIKGFVY